MFSRTLNFSQSFNSQQSNFLIIVYININKPNQIDWILDHFPRLRYSQPSSPIWQFSKLLKHNINTIIRVKTICLYKADGSLRFQKDCCLNNYIILRSIYRSRGQLASVKYLTPSLPIWLLNSPKLFSLGHSACINFSHPASPIKLSP